MTRTVHGTHVPQRKCEVKQPSSSIRLPPATFTSTRSRLCAPIFHFSNNALHRMITFTSMENWLIRSRSCFCLLSYCIGIRSEDQVLAFVLYWYRQVKQAVSPRCSLRLLALGPLRSIVLYFASIQSASCDLGSSSCSSLACFAYMKVYTDVDVKWLTRTGDFMKS